MVNCRSVPPEAWAHAREALVRYFVSRHNRSDAEDMAQRTLMRVWEHEDFEFEQVSDFPKICLGFARMISLEQFRSGEDAYTGLDFDAPAPDHLSDSQRAAETRILVAEICKTGAKRLKPREWRAILDWISRSESDPDAHGKSPESNRDRVYLHRARRKLKEITGWGKNRV